MEPVLVHLDSRRAERAEKMMSLVDGISSINLAIEGRERLGRGGAAAAFGGAELVVAALLAVTAIAMLRGKGRYGRWVSGLAGVVLLLDGWSKTYGPKGHGSYALMLNGLALIAVAAAAPWLGERRARRRALRLDDVGIKYRRNRFRGWVVARENVAELQLGPKEALVRTNDARSLRIDLADLHNRTDVEAALSVWAAAQGVPLTPFPAPSPAPAPDGPAPAQS